MTPAETTTLSVQIDAETNKVLDSYKSFGHTSKESMVQEIVVQYALEQRDFMAAVQEGLDDVAAGRVVPHEAVMKWVKSLGTKNKLPRPRYEDYMVR